MKKKKLPFRKALYWIVFSTVLISGSTIVGVYYYQYLKKLQHNDEKYNIVAIVQAGPDKGILKTGFLAELLNLSIDHPTNLYSLNVEEARQHLLKNPLIRTAEVKRIKPVTLLVDYTVRKPVAYLSDFTNTAIDEEGFLIPFKPFFSPKKLPELYLGEIEECHWGKCLKIEKLKLGLELVKRLAQFPNVQKIDVSKSNAPSYGQREIVVTINTGSKSQILRLSRENYSQQLANYRELEKHLQDEGAGEPVLVIDLRVPSLAFISTPKS